MSKKNAYFTPWKVGQVNAETNVAPVVNAIRQELFLCDAKVAAVIVKAVNWCASRGYL